MITQNELKKVITYDAVSGKLKWIIGHRKGMECGCEFKSKRSGKRYRHTKIQGVLYLSHRLAWLHYHGEWPVQIDHEDGNGCNNLISNLRNVGCGDNNRNRRMPVDNKSGFVGVCWDKPTKKWRAQINHKNKRIHLGFFSEKESAISARKKANIKYGFHPNHGKIRPL